MSGICGKFNLDDEPVAAADLVAMTAMLEQRGPERTGRWQNGPLALGHTLLATTPELLLERQPFRHAETGSVITADVRLDNRDELLGALGLSKRRELIGDAELILSAYLEWAEACLDRLLGDFAFAIWDPRQRILFCARDHFGMRPFYYHHMPGKQFLFASDARAMLVLPQVPYKINEGRIADFLVPELEWIDYTSTFFEGIYRLPPGHKAIVTTAGLSVTEYWKPVPGPELPFTSDEDYAQGFLEVFTTAVEARLRAPPGIVGSMLSGGMDSGSVVAVAKEILTARGDGPLHTFSAVRRVTDITDCAESRAIYAATSVSLISPALVHPDVSDDVLQQMIAAHEEPYDGEFMILKAVYLAAHEQGIRVVIDGAGGDVVLGEGTYIARLIRQGHFRLALAEITGETKFWGGSIAFDVLHYLRGAAVPEVIKNSLRSPRSRRSSRKYVKASLISRDFANTVHIEERCERLRQMFQGGWTEDYAVERCNAVRPNMTGGRERYARIAAAAGMEACDPFMDKRVVDYCTRLPGRVRMQHGWPKMFLRELMAGKIPDEVRWCREKPHLGWLFNVAITEKERAGDHLDLARLQTDLGDYVDSTALASAWQSYRAGGEAEQIHSAHLLSLWLREVAQRPTVPE